MKANEHSLYIYVYTYDSHRMKLLVFVEMIIYKLLRKQSSIRITFIFSNKHHERRTINS